MFDDKKNIYFFLGTKKYLDILKYSRSFRKLLHIDDNGVRNRNSNTVYERWFCKTYRKLSVSLAKYAIEKQLKIKAEGYCRHVEIDNTYTVSCTIILLIINQMYRKSSVAIEFSVCFDKKRWVEN